ncbi:MAG: deoxyribodipyrimidine photo-lyase [Chitinophagaceae bacterium]|nr:deoxyribodipyrimidine photo-lyase [Chitinophagaceae bacterium]
MRVSIMWFRRDLRLHDNAALHHALKSGTPVVPIFIFDRRILDQLEEKQDARVEFIHQAIASMQSQLLELNSGLEVFYGYPAEVFGQLISRYELAAVYANHDYEPYARQRDENIAGILQSKNIAFHTFKDQVVFEKSEIIKDDGRPYTVFTPYSKRWKACLNPESLQPYATKDLFDGFYRRAPTGMPSLEDIGFRKKGIDFPQPFVADMQLEQYRETRDIPSLPQGTSRLGVHLRFGTLSIRDLAARALRHSDTYLNELIWREFYQMILWHFPQVGKGASFRPEYDLVKWRNNEEEFARWCAGATGYPIVDAGMRELNATGFMHNRVRMIVASFLTKHLLIDWRWGEAWFAQKLLDYELASNNGGWQWASGSGCDAAPYFRVFNPWLQAEKFDPDLTYVKQWVPEWQDQTYPPPMVDHGMARKRALEAYGDALKRKH